MLKLLQRCSAFTLALLMMLLPIVGWAQTSVKEQAQAAKLTPDLLRVATNQNVGTNSPADELAKLSLLQTRENTISIEAFVVDGQDVQVLFQALQRLGLRDGFVYRQMVVGFLPIDKLTDLASIPSLKFARPTYKPTKNVGAVTSQGDIAMRSNIARTTYGVNGAGTKVGVLSDSYNSLGGAASGVSTGDLPAGVQVIQDYIDPDASDEGRAMAELIYDVAPGVTMAFNTAFVGGEAGFAQGIRNLAAAGCQVITDDVGYFAEPFFQDGIIAQAVDEVTNNNGAIHFSSAGNSARSSYQNTFSGTSFSDPAYGTGTFTAHNFGSGDTRQSITIPGGRQVLISFQWDDPFFSVSGGAGAQTDMDLLVYRNNVLRTDLSSIGNNIGGDPVEIIGVANNGGSPITIELVLVKNAGPNPSLVKWVNFGNTVTIEYDTKSSTSVGHSNSSRAVGVGAAFWNETPAYNAALTTAIIEPFSSAGGTPILFNTAGQRITSITRQKPEITAADGGNTTFFASDISQDADAFPNFFGTSAAAPHAAGVAALMRQRSGNTITPASILSILQQTALDMDDPLTPTFDTGFDFRTGYGFIQADAALQAIGGSTNTAPTVANTIAPQSSTVGQAFTYTIPANTFTDTETPNGLTVSVSGLPPGLSFSAGVISGTPTTAGSYTVTVTATDPGGLSVSTTFVITVTASGGGPNTAPTVANPIPPQSATVGQAYSFTIPANTFTDAQTPNSLTITVLNSLPAGLTFSNGVISGTPTTTGTFTIILRATDPSRLSVTTTFRLTISPASGGGNTAPTLANTIPPQSATVNQAFTYTIPTNTFTDAQTPNGLTVSVGGLPPGLSFSAGVISGTPTTAGSYTVTVTATDPGGLSVSTTFVITVSAASGGNTAPTVANTIPPQSATVNQAFTYTIPANTFTDTETPNGLTVSVSGLPPGLSFANGVISGTPTTAGSYTVTVTATDPGGLSVSTTFVITVTAAGGGPNTAPTVANPIPPQSATVGQAYSFTIPANTFTDAQTPNNLTITVIGLPAGLTYSNGVISGTPRSAGTRNILVRATDPGGLSVNLFFTLTIRAATGGRIAAGETTPQLKVVLYPNPVGDEFAIAIQGAEGQRVQIVLTDMNGHAVANTSVEVKTPEHREQLKFGQQRAAGLYFLRVSTNQQSAILKVVKQ